MTLRAKIFSVAAAAFSLPHPGDAAAFPTGVYSRAADCRSKDVPVKSEPTPLSAEGLETIVWNCDSIEIRSVYDDVGWLIDAV